MPIYWHADDRETLLRGYARYANAMFNRRVWASAKAGYLNAAELAKQLQDRARETSLLERAWLCDEYLARRTVQGLDVRPRGAAEGAD